MSGPCPCRTGYASDPGTHNNQVRLSGRCSCACHTTPTLPPQPPGQSTQDLPPPAVRYQVRISRTVETTVEVEADSPQAAAEVVDSRDYPLPPPEAWDTVKRSWQYVVVGDHGRVELFRDESGDLQAT